MERVAPRRSVASPTKDNLLPRTWGRRPCVPVYSPQPGPSDSSDVTLPRANQCHLVARLRGDTNQEPGKVKVLQLMREPLGAVHMAYRLPRVPLEQPSVGSSSPP